MRQIVTSRNGGVDVLNVVEAPKPKPGPREVLISVKASGLNFADILARQGLYPDAPRKPCVLGYEVSGIVEEVGENLGKELMGQSVLASTRFGGQSEYVKIPVDYVFEKPPSLSFEEAAAIPVNYLTAHILLVVMGSLKRGEILLIHNAGGGVGLAVLDIAKHIGAKTIGTASSTKHHLLFERGLDHAIDYRTRDWLPEVLKLTGGKGVDLVIDPLGPASWRKSYSALANAGRLGMFGWSDISGGRMRGLLLFIRSSLRSQGFRPLSLMGQGHGVFGFNLGHFIDDTEKIRTWMEAILEGVKEGWIHPHIAGTFRFDQVAEAHRFIESRSNFGKVVLVP
jgi:synaptic vesicle membrane protein VAT-1